uniref:PB1-like domain-containing protein n=1 Tax=Chenopodium quinoa TaxID=63459 RepID=A0A803KXD8_CHEQI
MGENVTLRFWHGGTFKTIRNGELVYMGGEGKSFDVDPDELCYFDLIEMAKKCGQYNAIDGLFYLVPGMYLVDGIRRIGGDAEVIEMGQLLFHNRSLELYVKHTNNYPEESDDSSESLEEKNESGETVSQQQVVESEVSKNKESPKPLTRKKITPKRGPPIQLVIVPRRSPRKHVCFSDSTTTPNKKSTGKGKKIDSQLSIIDATLSCCPKPATSFYTQPTTSTKATTSVNDNSEPSSVGHIFDPNNNIIFQPTVKDLDPYTELHYDWEDDRPETRSAPQPATTASQHEHHANTAHPTQLGRGGRVILGGRGARGGSSQRGKVAVRGRGRGRSQMAVGIGVLFGADSSVVNQVPQARGRGRPRKHQPTLGTESSQASTGHQPTQ